MDSVSINNIPYFYKATGDGEPLLLVHGHPFDHTMWNPQVEALSDSYQIITPDLRGYGKTGLPNTPTKFEDYATDLLQLADHLGIEKFHTAGLSQGGQIVMEIYRQAPHRVKSLILADTFASADTPEAKQARYDAADKFEKEGMTAYADDAIYKMLRRENVAKMPDVANFLLSMMKASSPKGAATAVRARAERIDYLNQVLPGIAIPTLIIVGRQDEFTPVAKAEEMHKAIKSSRLVVIEDAGHLPNLEHPDEFNKVVRDFLADV